MRGCFMLIGLALLAVALASVAILVQIRGTSDGPAALFLYFGAFLGFGGAWIFLSSAREKE